MQVTYRGGGPQYDTVEYLPHFHFQTGYALADENYDRLTEYWGSRSVEGLDGLETDSELVDRLGEEGAVEEFYRFLD